MPILPLAGRIALVTGVSRPQGIAFTLAERLADLGATVFASGWSAHDDEMPWGATSLDDHALRYPIEQRDLADASAAAGLVGAVVDRYGTLDIVLAVHARSSHDPLERVTADELDRCWAVNVRSIVLMARQWVERCPARTSGLGRFIWFTSGQAEQPMPSELAYAITKAALHQMTATVAHTLIDHGIVANCINPGPVDTGYATGAAHAAVASMFPGGRWGTPTDVANLVEFLVRDEGAWIQGQVLNSEGGFRRTS